MKLIIFLLFFACTPAFAKLQVVATTTDIASLVREVAGDQVEVFAIGKGTQDPHQIEAKPSFMVKMRSSDLVIAHGLELEAAWLQPLIQGSRNTNLLKADRILELAGSLDPLEIPTGPISRADGDVHPGGNPHFQLDPIRLGRAAILIAQKLSQLDPAHKDLFLKNAESFQKKMEDKTKLWQARLEKTKVREIVAYHKTFSYFCSRFALQCQLLLEPKPGIPPTAAHLLTVIEQMKKRQVKTVLIENLYEDRIGEKIKTALPGVFVAHVPVSVEGESGITNSEQLIERLVQAVEAGAK